MLTSLVIVSLATWQAVEIWQHSSLFAGWRADVEVWLATDTRVRSFLGALLSCPHCLSVWVAMLMHILFACISRDLVQLFLFLPLGLASSRLANLGNDVFHGYCRTPNREAPELQTAIFFEKGDPFHVEQ